MVKKNLNELYEMVGIEPNPSITSGDRFVEYNLIASTDAGMWSAGALTTDRVNQRAKFVYYNSMPDVYQEEQDSLRSECADKDPETQMDLVDNEEDQTQDLIFRIRTSTSIPYRERLANRLLTLFNDAKEEDPASLGIVFGSLHDFYNFLQLHTNLKYPSITLSPDNNILASWRSKQSQVFNVHFLSNKDVRFVIFKPNKKYPDRKFRFSGAATTDTLMDEIPKDMLDWIT